MRTAMIPGRRAGRLQGEDSVPAPICAGAWVLAVQLFFINKRHGVICLVLLERSKSYGEFSGRAASAAFIHVVLDE